MKPALLLVLVSASCATSSPTADPPATAHVKQCRAALWSEVIHTIRARYPEAQIAELRGRRLVTTWMATDLRVREAVAMASGPRPRIAPLRPVVRRFTVAIAGTNPYELRVDVETAVESDGFEGAAPIHHLDMMQLLSARAPKQELARALDACTVRVTAAHPTCE
jgi:hypothetical protein